MAPKAQPTKAAPAKPAAAPAKSNGKALAKPNQVSSALAGLDDDLLSDLQGDIGAGLEKATQQDYALPFFYLMQKMSPQVDEADAKYIEGAKPGMFLNTVTQELHDKLRVIPVDFEKVYIEWIPRDQGGGFVAQYKTKQDAEANCGEGHQIVDTANHYVLVQGADGEWSMGIFSMTSTKLKASRKWVSMMGMVTIPVPGGGKKTAPTYARYYDILPDGPMKNENGTYYTVKVQAVEGEEGWVKDASLREMAKDFRAALQSGAKGADYQATAEAVVEDLEDDETDPKF